MSGKQNRLKHWRDLIKKSNRLTSEEYLEMLHEIRAYSGFTLLERSMIGVDDGIQAYVSMLDKVHWLIDSAEKKTVQTTGIEIGFELPGIDEQREA